MPIQVLMPALSPTMEEGKLAKWLKAEGDPVKSGDVIAEIETDKATMEVEAVDEGVLGKILIAAGTEGVKVNTPIALILGDGEDKAALEEAQAPAAPAPSPPAPPPPAPSSPEAPAAPTAKAEAPPRPVHAEPKPAPAEAEYTGETYTATMREALRDAMAEEMRRDGTVFLMGEEVA
ncbi:MAG: pyruvate dehydrogenase complex E1 component subunit beta, partial [Rhodospirillaceae bacterium]|nr:pyruvate dehydrogenase complex E1 component subunit beta [Rhodospirillaceae bacterium]